MMEGMCPKFHLGLRPCGQVKDLVQSPTVVEYRQPGVKTTAFLGTKCIMGAVDLLTFSV
jgi:hypothetical protein